MAYSWPRQCRDCDDTEQPCERGKDASSCRGCLFHVGSFQELPDDRQNPHQVKSLDRVFRSVSFAALRNCSRSVSQLPLCPSLARPSRRCRLSLEYFRSSSCRTRSSCASGIRRTARASTCHPSCACSHSYERQIPRGQSVVAVERVRARRRGAFGMCRPVSVHGAAQRRVQLA